MKPRSYCLLAAAVFAIVALLQLLRAVMGWPVTIDGIDVPVSASWIAFIVAGVLSVLGFAAASRL
jgi:hypothetical protein